MKNGYYWCKDPDQAPTIVYISHHPAWEDGPYVIHRFGVSTLSEWSLRHPEAKWEGPLVCSL